MDGIVLATDEACYDEVITTTTATSDDADLCDWTDVTNRTTIESPKRGELLQSIFKFVCKMYV